MLAQRQREIYSIQHRQRQLFQQKVMLMRQNMAGAPAGSVGSIGTARAPKVAPTTPQQPQQPPQQQFSFPQAYNPMTGKTPTSPNPFSPMPGGPLDNKLTVRVPLNNQTLLGGVQGQFNSTMNSSIQQGLFQQFGGSGEFKSLSSGLLNNFCTWNYINNSNNESLFRINKSESHTLLNFRIIFAFSLLYSFQSFGPARATFPS